MLFLLVVASLALMTVLSVGTILMELLIKDAPRRGKRPDVTEDPVLSEVVLRVVTSDGQTVVGKPLTIVQQLRQEGFAPSPRYLNVYTAERTLENWERLGIVRIRGEWRAKN